MAKDESRDSSDEFSQKDQREKHSILQTSTKEHLGYS